MVLKECFTRSHFWVRRGASLCPMLTLGEDVELSFSWQSESLLFFLEERSKEPFEVHFPKYREGDALVLFIDTRPTLKARSMQRQCHQFLVLPEAVDGIQSQEITRFHSYESRPLLKDNCLIVQTERTQHTRSYQVQVPLEKLFGYDEGATSCSFAVSYFSKGYTGAIHSPIPTVLPEKVPYMWPMVHLL